MGHGDRIPAHVCVRQSVAQRAPHASQAAVAGRAAQRASELGLAARGIEEHRRVEPIGAHARPARAHRGLQARSRRDAAARCRARASASAQTTSTGSPRRDELADQARRCRARGGRARRAAPRAPAASARADGRARRARARGSRRPRPAASIGGGSQGATARSSSRGSTMPCHSLRSSVNVASTGSPASTGRRGPAAEADGAGARAAGLTVKRVCWSRRSPPKPTGSLKVAGGEQQRDRRVAGPERGEHARAPQRARGRPARRRRRRRRARQPIRSAGREDGCRVRDERGPEGVDARRVDREPGGGAMPAVAYEVLGGGASPPSRSNAGIERPEPLASCRRAPQAARSAPPGGGGAARCARRRCRSRRDASPSRPARTRRAGPRADDERLGLEADPRLDVAALGVGVVELVGELGGALLVLGQQQLERAVGPVEPARGVEARREPERERALVDAQRVDATRRASARAARAAPSPRARAVRRARGGGSRRAARTTSATVASATSSSSASRSPPPRPAALAQRLRELRRDRRRAEARAGIAAERGVHVRRIGQHAVGAGAVVVGDEHVDAAARASATSSTAVIAQSTVISRRVPRSASRATVAGASP